GYFNTKITTLKYFIIISVLLLTSLASYSQSFNNIEFVENKGQWDSRVKFKGNVSNGTFFLRSGGFTVVQHNPADLADMFDYQHGKNAALKKTEDMVIRSHAFDVDFIGASANSRIIPDKIANGYSNYFIGDDPTKWASECRIYQAVTIENIYPNIDARYYTDNGFLKYDLLVKPGADISKIALKYKGVERVDVKNKQLAITTSVGELIEGAPYTFQFTPSGKKEVNCKYTVKDNIVRFDVKDYDPTSTLIIDPSIVFCSFSGSTSDNWGFTATYGPDGSMFGGGIVFGSGFPVSLGAFQTNYQSGEFDIGIIKLSPDGVSRLYATYIGGSGSDQPHSLIATANGELVIAGRSNSGNYPVRNNGTVAGTGFDIVVTKLNASGTNIIGSRKIGGSGNDGVNISTTRNLSSLQRNYGDDGRSEVNLDGAGNVYVASCTQSSNFPGTTGFFQSTFGGSTQDGVVLKFDATLNTLLFASYLGGNGNDAAYVLNIGSGGNIYVAGGTESTNLLGNTTGTIGPSNHGGIDGFVSIINNNGTSILRTTYLGTTGSDQIFGIQFDISGFPYVMGQTTGSWQLFPAGVNTYGSSTGKQFIAKLQPDLSAYIYSTVFGTGSSNPNISPIAFLVDRCENVYISGWGGFYGSSNNFNSAGTVGLPVTPDAFKSNTDGKDLYFFVLRKNATGSTPLFASFFGQFDRVNEGCDHVDGGTSRFDRNGTIYQAICANCKSLSTTPIPTFPTTPGVWSFTNPANSGGGCNLAMLKIAMNLAGVAGAVQSSIDGVPRDTAGCVPLTVDFKDTIANAQSYEWYFDYVPGNPPNQTTTIPSSQWTFNTVGVHLVMLVAIDPTTCNVRDSSFMHIKVGATQALPTFTALRQEPCQDFKYLFTNTTIEPPLVPFKNNSFIWDFGDGTTLVTSGNGPQSHQYAGPGTFIVKLSLNDTNYCNSPDSDTLRLEVTLNVRAGIQAPDIACIDQAVQFTSTSSGADTYLWEFGDGNSSTDANPIHTYNSAQTFTVTLTVFNPGSCNKQDVTTYTIIVYDTPTAQATYAPDPPQVNTPTSFTNLSLGAVRYKWLFGDGDSALTNSLIGVNHQYVATGTFNALLIAYNLAGCADTFPMTVRTLIEPVVDVPNAFTPQSKDENSIVYVRGFGISKMQFIIWNRWGQKVFETNNQKIGWDG
ncbi:MAG: PKD domain-containing protein, partial [Chitinophagaceae bacterium]